MQKLKNVSLTICSLLILIFTSVALAKTTANIHDGVMLYGYDPVSYFNSPKPINASLVRPQIKSEFNGLIYLFSNEKNKQLFMTNPSKYIPQYEGWCAWAVAEGSKFDIDPENFKIMDGRLLLFYNGWRGDTLPKWNKNQKENLKRADNNWPKVKESEE